MGFSEPMTSHTLTGVAGNLRTLPYTQEQQAAGRCHGHHLESITSHQKFNYINRCAFTLRTILPNFIPIRFETTEP